MRLEPIDSPLGSLDGPGVVPETILSEQFFRPSAALPPEKRLMLAVLRAALLDLQRSGGVLLRWLSLTRRGAFAGPAAVTLILLATAATLVAAQSGEDAHVAVEAAPGIAAAVRAHQQWGERTRNVALLVGGLELLTLALRGRSIVRTMSFVSAGFGLLAFLCVLQTGKLGGELVYGHAGGVGIRSGDPEDVARLFLAGLFRQAELDEKAGRAGDAASLLEIAARRFPADPAVPVRAAA